MTADLQNNMIPANMTERRRHFLINRSFQFRYMVAVTSALLIVSLALLISLYFGIWGSILDSYSSEKVQSDLQFAARIAQYDDARLASQQKEKDPLSTLSLFQQAEKLSERQREIFRNILDETNRSLFPKLLILLALIAWGSVYISHKIAGPLYRFQSALDELDKGNFRTRIHLRKFDEGKDVALRFNQTIEKLDQQFAQLKKISSENPTRPDVTAARLKEALEEIQTSSDN